MREEFRVIRPSNMHTHLRIPIDIPPEIFKQIVRWAAHTYYYVVHMGNHKDPLDTVEKYIWTREKILEAADGIDHAIFLIIPMMTDNTTTQDIHSFHKLGVVGMKTIRLGVTTNSAHGVSDVKAKRDEYRAMECCGMIDLDHGEEPGFPWHQREIEYTPTFEWKVKTFPDMRIVKEHLQTAFMLGLILDYPDNVGATITPQHATRNSTHVFGPDDQIIHPEEYCIPVPRYITDNEALQAAMISDNPKLFFGDDDAPHMAKAKRGPNPAGGVTHAGRSPQYMATYFERLGALDWRTPEGIGNYQAFMSINGPRFYGLKPPTEQILMVRSHSKMPNSFGGMVPMAPGHPLAWRIDQRYLK